jgi:hypothetical protein
LDLAVWGEVYQATDTKLGAVLPSNFFKASVDAPERVISSMFSIDKTVAVNANLKPGDPILTRD